MKNRIFDLKLEDRKNLNRKIFRLKKFYKLFPLKHFFIEIISK